MRNNNTKGLRKTRSMSSQKAYIKRGKVPKVLPNFQVRVNEAIYIKEDPDKNLESDNEDLGITQIDPLESVTTSMPEPSSNYVEKSQVEMHEYLDFLKKQLVDMANNLTAESNRFQTQLVKARNECDSIQLNFTTIDVNEIYAES